jgi:hypothetical protein
MNLQVVSSEGQKPVIVRSLDRVASPQGTHVLAS